MSTESGMKALVVMLTAVTRGGPMSHACDRAEWMANRSPLVE
jgi:hypothetical protein